MTRYEIAVFCILAMVFAWACLIVFAQTAYPKEDEFSDPFADEYPGVSAPREEV